MERSTFSLGMLELIFYKKSFNAARNAQTNRLISRLALLFQEGDADALSIWIKDQSWSQLEMCLIRQSVKEGKSIMSALHGMSLLIKEGASQESVTFVVQSYVNAGCNINEACNELEPRRRGRQGFTPLLLAIERLNVTVVKALISAGADVNQRDTAGWSPLHWAAYIGLDIGAFENLVKAGADMTYFVRKLIQPILHIAVDEGREGIVTFLLENGVDVNTESTYSVISEESSQSWFMSGQGPNRYDCGNLRESIVEKKITAVGRAVRMRKIAVLNILLRYAKAKLSLDELHFCILLGDSRVANTILEHMDDKSFIAEDKINGKWALHCLGHTAFTEKYEVNPIIHTMKLVQNYMMYGWDVNSVSDIAVANTGQESCTCTSLLIRAVTEQNNEFVRFLVGVGAICTIVKNSQDKCESPLHAAIRNTNLEALTIFANAGFDFSLNFDSVINGLGLRLDAAFLDRGLTVFEKVLSLPVKDEIEAVLILKTVKKVLEDTTMKIDIFHIVLAMTSLNLEVVLEVLNHLPKTFTLKGLKILNVPILQWFIHHVLFSQSKVFTIEMEILLQIVKTLQTKGYDLNAFEPDPNWKHTLSTMAIRSVLIPYDRGTQGLFDFLIDTPGFDWNQKDMDNETPIDLALRLCLTAPGRIDSQMRNVIMKLLRKGVHVDGLGSVVDVLSKTTVYFKLSDVVKSLWWAGLDFTGYERFLMDKSDLTDLDTDEKEALNKMLDWWSMVGKIQCLSRLAAITVRKSLKYVDLDSLEIHSFLKELIVDVPGHLK